MRRRPTAWLVVLSVLVLFPQLRSGFVVWLMGSAVFHADQRWRGRIGRRAGLAGLAVSGLLLAAFLGAARARLFGDVLSDLLVGISFAGLCWALLVVDPRPLRGLGAMARYGANASYSLYVTHLPLLVLLAAVTVRMLGGGQRLVPGGTALAAFLGLVLAVIAWAWGFARLTESRTPLLRDRVKAALGLRKPATG